MLSKLESVKFLSDWSAKQQLKNRNGYTPLMLACLNADEQIIKAILMAAEANKETL